MHAGKRKTSILRLELWPDKAQHQPGEPIRMTLKARLEGSSVQEGFLVLTLIHLEKTVWTGRQPLLLGPGLSEIGIALPAQSVGWAGFGVHAGFTGAGNLQATAWTAIDISDDAMRTPRYGFLAAFPPGTAEEVSETVDAEVRSLSRFHLNVIQYYDWMYRHDTLLPPQDIFLDPLGRTLSLSAVAARIRRCAEAGMLSLAYGAIYGASEAFRNDHPDWSLYRNDGDPLSFGSWLHIMNTAADSPWRAHIADQFAQAAKTLGFDGIHLDTYGWPKVALASPALGSRIEHLDTHFPGFIDEVRTAMSTPDRKPVLLFNAVGNWPPDAAAIPGTDAAYVEVWDPLDRYAHLHRLIREALREGGKPVILAAYLAPFARERREETHYVQQTDGTYSETGALRCYQYITAVIAASGGQHLVLGGNAGILTNNYYCDHATLTDPQRTGILAYQDFLVRYTELLYDPSLRDLSMTHANGINTEFRFEGAPTSSDGEPGMLWTLINQGPGKLVLHLVNLCGIRDDRWNAARNESPGPVGGFVVHALVYETVLGVYHASPDSGAGCMVPLSWEWEPHAWGRAIRFTLPEIDIWSMVYIQTGSKG